MTSRSYGPLADNFLLSQIPCVLSVTLALSTNRNRHVLSKHLPIVSEFLRFPAILRNRQSGKAARIHKQLSSPDNCPAKMHPKIHLTILAAAFHLGGLVRCASALLTFAVVTDFISTSWVAMTYPTPQETVLSHLSRKISDSTCKRTRSPCPYLFSTKDTSTLKRIQLPGLRCCRHKRYNQTGLLWRFASSISRQYSCRL